MTEGQASKLGIVILNWNGEDHILECLASISHSRLQPAVVVVVDNNSTDGSPDMIEKAYPDTVVIRNQSNLGFAKANNLGGADALNRGCDLVLFLNNDTLLADDALGLMVAATEQLGVMVVNPQILDLHDDVWFAGATFKRWKGEVKHDLIRIGGDAGLVDIDSATGCALLTTAAVVSEFGPFEERYFIYYEDADLSATIRSRGGRVVMEPAALIKHKVGGDSLKHGSSGFFYYLNTRNRLLFANRHLSTFRWTWFLVMFTVTYVIPRAAILVMLGRVAKAKALLDGYWDYFRARFGPPRLAGWRG